MAIATISELSEALSAGARPNFFKVQITAPSFLEKVSAENINAAMLLCKTAAIPGMTVGVIEVPFRGGRRIKIPGDRTFADWTATFISDSNHSIRRFFLEWHEQITAFDFDSATLRKGEHDAQYDYSSTIVVQHLRQDGSIARTYTLFEAFPTDIGAIDLSFDSTDTISEFTVTFQYHHMTSASSSAGTEEIVLATDDDLEATDALATDDDLETTGA